MKYYFKHDGKLRIVESEYKSRAHAVKKIKEHFTDANGAFLTLVK